MNYKIKLYTYIEVRQSKMRFKLTGQQGNEKNHKQKKLQWLYRFRLVSIHGRYIALC